MPPHPRPLLLGIVNVTRDSFSDGGRYLDPAAAIDHALALVGEGADGIDAGAESTHPDSEDVDAREEIRRLEPVVPILAAQGVRISVDTWKPEVMAEAVRWGAEWINDVRGFEDPASVDAVRDSRVVLIAMHNRSRTHRAARRGGPAGETALESALKFFGERPGALVRSGVPASRIVLDPGMGLFLGPDPRDSVEVLRAIPAFRNFGFPVLISVSRKSFIGSLSGRNPRIHGAGTVAAEVFAAESGADMIRTHDPGALRDALRVAAALGKIF